jgi:hypothetical protein
MQIAQRSSRPTRGARQREKIKVDRDREEREDVFCLYSKHSPEVANILWGYPTACDGHTAVTLRFRPLRDLATQYMHVSQYCPSKGNLLPYVLRAVEMTLSEGNLVVFIFAYVTQTGDRLLVGSRARNLVSSLKHNSISISNVNFHQNNSHCVSTPALSRLLTFARLSAQKDKILPLRNTFPARPVHQ